MATLNSSTSQYRDGVFSAASPAPRYGQLLTVFENGSLGSTVDEDASAVLDAALDRVIASLQPDGLQSRALPPAAMASAATAVALAHQARAEVDVGTKIVLAVAASYAATFFGLPRNDLAYIIDQVCGMFALTSAQRREYHQQAARVLDKYVASLRKGNAMSGVFKDGVLGVLVNQQGATRDGSLGAVMYQNHAVRDGSLGAMMYQPRDYRDGSLGAGMSHPAAASTRVATVSNLALRRRASRRLSGLGGGCGCSGVGDDAVVASEPPFYKKPLYIGGAAIALGVVLYAVTRK